MDNGNREAHPEKCSNCKGKGVVFETIETDETDENGKVMKARRAKKCPNCDGTGKLPAE